jgi:hypothetical protein
MFRMKKEWFDEVCKNIIKAVGDSVFKSERWLQENSKSVRTKEACDKWGGLVTGEIKVACKLRMLAGASYLDHILRKTGRHS